MADIATSRLLRAALAIAIALGTAQPALAERADRDKPVNIEADRMSYDDLRRVNVFEGNVTLTQGSLVIRTERLTVRQDAEGFQRGVAEKGPGGFAYFRQKREGLDEFVEGWGERIDYDAKADRAELSTRARILRGADEVRGNVINYDARTEFYNVVGGGAPAGESTDGRVRAVISPKSQTPAAQPADSPRPSLTLKPSGGVMAPRQDYPEAPKR